MIKDMESDKNSRFFIIVLLFSLLSFQVTWRLQRMGICVASAK